MEEKKEVFGISEFQTYLFNSGDNFRAYEFLGCHRIKTDDMDGWRFAVWAPNAVKVQVACESNDWSGSGKELIKLGQSGVWCGFFSDVNEGDLYKYAVTAPDGKVYLRSDPYAVR